MVLQITVATIAIASFFVYNHVLQRDLGFWVQKYPDLGEIHPRLKYFEDQSDETYCTGIGLVKLNSFIS